MMTHEVNFEVIPSLDKFFFSEKFISLAVGPIGSLKTTAGIMKIIHHAAQMAPCADGIRRSKAVWVRNTREQLRDTSIPDFLKWIPDGVMGSFLKTEYKFVIKIADLECEVLFRGLDDSNDVRRLLSLQASFIVFDEFREIHPDIYEAAQGRVGRYPDKMLVPPRKEWGVDSKGNPIGGCVKDDGSSNALIWGMTNPPDQDTYWEELLTNPPDNVEVTIQPSGLAPEADWVKFLATDYYENLAHGKDQDWIDVYIHSQFGKSLSGQPVFKSFDRKTHVAKEALVPRGVLLGSGPILIGVDAGLTPAAVLGQVTYDGRVVVYDAITAEGTGALRFIREKLKPLLANKYPNMPTMVLIDPAAFQRVQTDERTVADMYKNEGFSVKPAKTNSITARIAAVEKFLTRVVDGRSGLVVCPEGAKPLVQALAGKYRYKINKKGEKDEKPEKNHPWSDLCFISGTPIKTPGGDVSVESLCVGDLVCVADGVDVVVGVGSRVPDEELLELTFSDGTSLTCTKDHPFYVKSHSCFLPADTLTSEHVLGVVEDGIWANGQLRTRVGTGLQEFVLSVVKSLKFLNGKLTRERGSIALNHVTASGPGRLMESSTTGCGSPGQGKTSITGTNEAIKAQSHCTSTCGVNTMELYPMGLLSTTSTTIQETTLWRILSCLILEATPECTSKNAWKKAPWTLRPVWSWLEKRLKRGIDPRRVENGTAGMRTVVSSKTVPTQRVYNITTRRTHTYYAGGYLVHNCDGFEYLCLHADGGETFGTVAGTAARREVRHVSPLGWT